MTDVAGYKKAFRCFTRYWLLLRYRCIKVRDILVLTLTFVKELHRCRDDVNRYSINLVLVLVGTEHKSALHKHEHAFSGILSNDFCQLVPGHDSEPHWLLVFPLVNCQGKLCDWLSVIGGNGQF